MKLNNFLKKLLLLLPIAAIYTGCAESEEKVKPTAIELAVDKDYLKSDGNEKVTFSVKADGKDISADARLFYKSTNLTPLPLSGRTFSTNISGDYVFYATYEGLTTQEVKIHAVPFVLIFSADVTSIKADRKNAVTFTVMADGENVSTKADIFLKNSDSDIRLENNTFFTDKASEYEFYCIYKDVSSNPLIITALPFVLTLKADATSFKANGKETITFTVLSDNENITSEAKIYCKNEDDEKLLEKNTFETTREGAYQFYARYLNQQSNTIAIEALVSRLTLSSDKKIAKTGETITFNAISDDVYDVSADITLHIIHNEQEVTQKGNVFIPSASGAYTIYASYDKKESNTIPLTVSPAKVELAIDKTAILSNGVDCVTFTVYADDMPVDDAAIYLIGNPDVKIQDKQFSSNIHGDYAFYAQYGETKSEIKTVRVYFVNFTKQSCIFAYVATWCGFSPDMVTVLSQVRNAYPQTIQTICIHRATSQLSSTDVVAETFLDPMGITSTPYGIMDYSYPIVRSLPHIYQNYQMMKANHPVKAGIAINSQITDNQINVSLKIKVNETNEYRVGAIIVEDNVIKRQVIYPNGNRDNLYWDDNYLHHSVAAYIMPGTTVRQGKSLGTMKPGVEVTETFSIPRNKAIGNNRTVNYANCRVIAYVFIKQGNDFIVNNVTSCPLGGYVDYLYE